MRVNLGCGNQVVEGWVNVDYALGARLTKVPLFSLLNKKFKFFRLEWDKRILIHDLRRRFPFDDNSVDVIYTSHHLEHFTREAGFRFLKECHRVIRANGVIRVVVPDLKAVVNKYTEGKIPADEFVEKLGVFPCGSGRGLVQKAITYMISFPHLCMYDEKTLLEKMKAAGFHAKQRKPFDSDIDDIKSIEIESRTRGAVIVEGRKVS